MPAPSQARINSLALWLAACQPSYPFYVKWLAGGDWWLGFATATAAVPLALVPHLARRAPLAGRWAVPLIGLLNTWLGVWLFGRGSGVGWLVVPCALVLACSGVARAKLWALALLAAGTGVIWAMPGPLGHFSPPATESLLRLNLGSAGLLCVLVPGLLGQLPWRKGERTDMLPPNTGGATSTP